MEEAVLRRAAPWILYELFLSYPIVTNVAFESFSCYDFQEGSYLMADVSVDCQGSEITGIYILSTIALVTYPLGLFVLYINQLVRVRHEMGEGNVRWSLRAECTRFLYKEYTVNFVRDRA